MKNYQFVRSLILAFFIALFLTPEAEEFFSVKQGSSNMIESQGEMITQTTGGVRRRTRRRTRRRVNRRQERRNNAEFHNQRYFTFS